MSGHSWHSLGTENVTQPRFGARVTSIRVAPVLDGDASTCANDRNALANGRPPCGSPVLIFETTRVETTRINPREKVSDEVLCRAHSARMMLRATGRMAKWEDNLPARAQHEAERFVLDRYADEVAAVASAHMVELVDAGISYLPAFLIPTVDAE